MTVTVVATNSIDTIVTTATIMQFTFINIYKIRLNCKYTECDGN